MKKNPKILYVRVSENCNSHCFMCHYAGKNDSYEITDLQYDMLLDYVKKNDIKIIRFTGGEPLLHKNLISFIKKATDLNIKTSIITNGFLLKRYAKRLCDAGLTQCIISLDGSCSEVHDNLRNFKGCFKNIISGIKELQKNNSDILIRVNTVVSGKNIFDLVNIYNLLLELNVKQWSIIPIKYKENTWNDESIIHYKNFLDNIKNNNSDKLYFLGNSSIFAGETEEEMNEVFSNNMRIKSKNKCSVIDYVRFYVPDKNLIVPCNCIAHRLSNFPLEYDGTIEENCEKLIKYMKKNCDSCNCCEPLNAYINDNPSIMLDEEIRY